MMSREIMMLRLQTQERLMQSMVVEKLPLLQQERSCHSAIGNLVLAVTNPVPLVLLESSMKLAKNMVSATHIMQLDTGRPLSQVKSQKLNT